MRTETDLRQALTELADSAPDPARVAGKLQLHDTASAPDRRAWRPTAPVLLAGIAAVLVVVLVAVLLPLLTSRREPADLRKPGYWGFISQVDPPTGWRLESQGIEGDREYHRLTQTTADSASCEAHVFGRGAFTGSPPGGTPVQVGDRPGIYVEGDAVEPAQLMWTYSEDAWALTTCTSSFPAANQQDLSRIATAVRFEPNPALVPVRLNMLPDGYTVSAVIESRIGATATGVISLAAPDRPTLSVFNTAEVLPPPGGPGMPGVEQLTINGHPVHLREDQRTAQISVGGQYVNITSTGGPANSQSWEPGEREAILELAADLRFADDLVDPNTWFNAERTLPS